jgi:hypothetical protein
MAHRSPYRDWLAEARQRVDRQRVSLTERRRQLQRDCPMLPRRTWQKLERFDALLQQPIGNVQAARAAFANLTWHH